MTYQVNKIQKGDTYNLKMVEYRLQEWWRWRDRLLTGGLGYSPTDTIAKAFTGGRSTAPFSPKIHEYAEEIDRIINKMESVKPKYSLVIKIHYSPGEFKEKFKKAQMPKPTYHRYLINAKSYIEKEIK